MFGCLEKAEIKTRFMNLVTIEAALQAYEISVDSKAQENLGNLVAE